MYRIRNRIGGFVGLRKGQGWPSHQTTQRISSYILEHRRQRTRYQIDLYLLKVGYDPVEIDLEWRLIQARPKRKLFPNWQTTYFWIKFGLIVLASCSILLQLTWEWLEWQFTAPGLSGKLVIISLIAIAVVWPRWSFNQNWTGKSHRLLRGLGLLSLVIGVMTGFSISPDSNVKDNSVSDMCYVIGTCVDTSLRVSTDVAESWNYAGDTVFLRVNNAHYFLTSRMIDGKDQSRTSSEYYYELKLYRCNSWGYDCRFVRQEVRLGGNKGLGGICGDTGNGLAYSLTPSNYEGITINEQCVPHKFRVIMR